VHGDELRLATGMVSLQAEHRIRFEISFPGANDLPDAITLPLPDKAAYIVASCSLKERVVQKVQVREAKARFSALVEAAEHGRPTTITRHGQPAAVLVPVADARRLYPEDSPSFADLLLSFPGGIEFDRDPSPMREIDL
jgi:prevent-host-death family protein